MKDNKNVILYILSYLTKYYKKNNKIPTYEEYKIILEKLNYESLSKDRHLYQFFVDNVDDNVNWKEFDLTPFSNSFVNKIKMIASGQEPPSKVFTDPIDDYFKLGGSYSDNYIMFYNHFFTINFEDSFSSFMLNLIGYDEHDLLTYLDARNGNRDCYVPEYDEADLFWILNRLSNDELLLISKIAKLSGQNKLSLQIQSKVNQQQRLSDDLIQQILILFRELYSQTLNNIFDEYSVIVNDAACDTVIEAFESSFPNGLKYVDSTTLRVDYDFFIKFLQNNPEVKTFADLKSHEFMVGDDISSAMYDYTIDNEELNRKIYDILDKLVDKLEDEDDEDFNKKIKNYEKAQQILENLKFKVDERGFYVKDTRKYSFVINPDKIDYNSGKLRLDVYFKHGDLSTHDRDHIIPFDDLERYVTMEQLFENILSRFL